jgi:hypothetical protein
VNGFCFDHGLVPESCEQQGAGVSDPLN